MLTLDYTKRNISEDASAFRKKGLLPAVFYGKKQQSTPMVVAMSDFMKVWKEAGESSVVSLKAKGVNGSIETLIHEVAVDPLSGKPIHVDFYVFEKGQKIEVPIPLQFIGVSPAVKDLGGNLLKILHEIKVSASPEHLPHALTVDISTLATFEDHILVKDLVVAKEVTILKNPDEIVASVLQQQNVEEELAKEITENVEDIEKVEKEKKEEVVIEEPKA